MMTQKQVRKTKEGISFGLKVLLGILFISPLIIGFLFSIQYEDELTSSPLRLFTANPTLINYIEVFQKVPLLSYLKNSLIVCVLAIRYLSYRIYKVTQFTFSTLSEAS